jgi:hypothetical protein
MYIYIYIHIYTYIAVVRVTAISKCATYYCVESATHMLLLILAYLRSYPSTWMTQVTSILWLIVLDTGDAQMKHQLLLRSSWVHLTSMNEDTAALCAPVPVIVK